MSSEIPVEEIGDVPGAHVAIAYAQMINHTTDAAYPHDESGQEQQVPGTEMDIEGNSEITLTEDMVIVQESEQSHQGMSPDRAHSDLPPGDTISGAPRQDSPPGDTSSLLYQLTTMPNFDFTDLNDTGK